MLTYHLILLSKPCHPLKELSPFLYRKVRKNKVYSTTIQISCSLFPHFVSPLRGFGLGVFQRVSRKPDRPLAIAVKPAC